MAIIAAALGLAALFPVPATLPVPIVPALTPTLVASADAAPLLAPVPVSLPVPLVMLAAIDPEPDTVVADTAFADTGDVVAAPHGFQAMCESDLPLCSALAAANSGPVVQDPAQQVALLERVNHEVNKTVRQASDMETAGVPDLWRRTGLGRDAAGDCEDIAIEKRLDLIAAGFPAEHLYFAVGYLPRLGLHAVLVAHTDKGEVVLDSRTAELAPWQRAPYIWVSRQTPGDPSRWTDPAPTLRMASRGNLSSRSGTTAALID